MVKDVFVNPYSFVPLPSDVKRQPRSGHDGRATEPVYSGWIDVEWRLETPLLLPANAEAEKWIRPEGSVNLPGSSLNKRSGMPPPPYCVQHRVVARSCRLCSRRHPPRTPLRRLS